MGRMVFIGRRRGGRLGGWGMGRGFEGGGVGLVLEGKKRGGKVNYGGRVYGA